MVVLVCLILFAGGIVLLEDLKSCSIIKLLQLLLGLVLFAWQYCFGKLHQYCDYQSERGEGEIIFPRRVTYLTGKCGSPNPS